MLRGTEIEREVNGGRERRINRVEEHYEVKKSEVVREKGWSRRREGNSD